MKQRSHGIFLSSSAGSHANRNAGLTASRSRLSNPAAKLGAFVLALGCGLSVLSMPSAAEDAKLLKGAKTAAPLTAAPSAKKPIGGAVRIPAGTMTTALTAAECTTLGGSSVNESVCQSGKACQTRTESGDWKRVCLSKAQ